VTTPNNILVIKSDKSELNRVEAFLRDIFHRYSLPESCFNKVFLCLSEAVVNSIIHGHKYEQSKEITVSVDCVSCTVAVTVTDKGDGFDVYNIEDPTKKENLKKESGRGIHIIKSISNSITFNEKGNSLKFQIQCS
jgi:serine/threonine-protein kinase RsbW